MNHDLPFLLSVSVIRRFLRRWFLVHKKGLDACWHKNRRRRGSRKNEVKITSPGTMNFTENKKKNDFSTVPPTRGRIQVSVNFLYVVNDHIWAYERTLECLIIGEGV